MTAQRGVKDPQAWTSAYREENGIIIANPVTPGGAALPEQIRLDTAEWQPILAEGDPTLGVHIPEIGPMDHAACGESFRRAMEFFPRHYPERPFRAFTCHSWLCDPQFETLMPPNWNMWKFQHEFYLYPTPAAGAHQMFKQLFGRESIALGDIPQTSSFLRLITRHLQSGGQLFGGGGVIFPEDLNWGAAVYRDKKRTP